MKKNISLFLFILLIQAGNAQTVKIIATGIKSSMRGLSVVDDKTIWVSGSGGMVGRSVDSGNTWKWMPVKGFEKTEFRDIQAFDEKTAVIMAVDAPAYILRTIDGGENWQTVYENKTKGMFLDAMEFWNEESGIVIGDPIDNKIFIARTFDGGKNWRDIPDHYKPLADSGEACFASSGTNIRALTKSEAVFITGGLSSHVFIRDKKINMPMIQGKKSTGANSIAVKNKKTLIVVGGDFATKDSTTLNCAITTNGGKTWTVPSIPPHGYRSCIEYLGKSAWITCGINGVDITVDDGKIFNWISRDGFNVCLKAKKGNAVFFAGNGKIGKLSR